MTTDIRVWLMTTFEQNWQADNTSGITPAINTGWYDQSVDAPQVSIPDANEDPSHGGQTGFSGIPQTGGTPIQNLIGESHVHVWSHRGDSANVNPKELTWQMAEEVRRIVRANFHGPSDYTFVSYRGRQWQPDRTQSPPVLRYITVIGFGRILD